MIVAAGLRPVLLGLIVGLGAGAPQVDPQHRAQGSLSFELSET
jgi:hypothetical protein